MSMGSIILQAADLRIMSASTVMMIHDGHDGFFGTPKELAEYAGLSKKIEDTVMRIYADRMGITKREFSKIYGPSKYYTANEAVKAGLADRALKLRPLKSPKKPAGPKKKAVRRATSSKP